MVKFKFSCLDWISRGNVSYVLKIIYKNDFFNRKEGLKLKGVYRS